MTFIWTFVTPHRCFWRLEMMGLDVGERWQALEAYNNRTADKELVFCTLHYLLTPIRMGDETAIKQSLQHLADWQTETSTQGKVVSEVGAPLAEAIRLLGAEQYQAAADQISELAPKLHLIGGSHAQRQLFLDMQVWAAAQAA